MSSPIPNINDYLTAAVKGKCFRLSKSESQIVQIVEFVPSTDTNSRAGVRIWYPLSDSYGFIDSDMFENYIPCSATEIDRVRLLAQSPAKCKEPVFKNAYGCQVWPPNSKQSRIFPGREPPITGE